MSVLVVSDMIDATDKKYDINNGNENLITDFDSHVNMSVAVRHATIISNTGRKPWVSNFTPYYQVL